MIKSLRLFISSWSFIQPAAVLGLMCFLFPASIAHSECNSWISCGLNGLRGEAAFQQIADFEKQKSDELLRQFNGNDEEIIKRLTAYKQSVARGSYRQTLRLCWAYRKAMGLENPHENANQIQSYNLEDSLKAWAEIYSHGLYQSVDGISGLKSDYILVAGLGLMDFESWFKSMYSLNFVTSGGFLYGASHCLNTVSARQIQKFASAILIVDYEGTLTSQIGVNWSLAKLIGLIAAPLGRWVLQPLSSTFETLVTKVGRPRLVTAAIPIGIVLGDQFSCHMARMEMASENLKAILAKPPEDKQNLRIQRALLVAQAYNQLHKSCTRTQEPSAACQKASKAFYQKIRETNFEADLTEYILDREQARSEAKDNSNQGSDTDLTRKIRSCDGPQKNLPSDKPSFQTAYADILDVVIPAVQKHMPLKSSR